MLSGERFPSAEAFRIGLVHQICGAKGLVAAAQLQINSLLLSGPNAMAAAKAAALDLASVARTPEQERALSRMAIDGMSSPEALEGVAAFLEKRPPSWCRGKEEGG